MKTILFLILVFLTGCLVKRNIFHDPQFYYDKENYTLIRVNPETREEDIKGYFSWKNKKRTIPIPTPTHTKPDTEKVDVAYDTPPKPKEIVKPVYPLKSKSKGYYGTVILKLLIDSTGIVILAKPIEIARFRNLDRGGILLVESALAAAIKSEFIPAYQDGKPTKVWVSFPVRFILHGVNEKRFPARLVP